MSESAGNRLAATSLLMSRGPNENCQQQSAAARAVSLKSQAFQWIPTSSYDADSPLADEGGPDQNPVKFLRSFAFAMVTVGRREAAGSESTGRKTRLLHKSGLLDMLGDKEFAPMVHHTKPQDLIRLPSTRSLSAHRAASRKRGVSW